MEAQCRKKAAHLQAGGQARQAQGDDPAAAGLDVGHLARILGHSRGALQQLYSRGDALDQQQPIISQYCPHCPFRQQRCKLHHLNISCQTVCTIIVKAVRKRRPWHC